MKVIMECNIILPDEKGRKRPYSCREVVTTSINHYEKVLKKWCQVLEWDVKKVSKPVEKVIEEEIEETVPHNKQVITSKPTEWKTIDKKGKK